MVARPAVGVLALQGAFRLHLQALERLGVEGFEVRTAEQLQACDALILPGGESTTMSMLLESQNLFDPLQAALDGGLAAFGTCAGMILLAGEIADGRDDQRCFGAFDYTARRNAYGRQTESFEVGLDVVGLDDPFHAVFIRAPAVEALGDDVEVLSVHHDEPVLCRSGAVMASSFHPELTNDDRIHQLFLDSLS